MEKGVLRVISAALAGMMLLAGCGSKGNTTNDANGQTIADVQTEAEQIESTGPEVGEATTEIQALHLMLTAKQLAEKAKTKQ